ncbi:GM23494 [Drosophila sechellia]|uniref:GM23494 n=1 Tax=Drosophila sechellia TaxID=7238 RepID=B4HGM3_DROSE|nr:GM23494 [Drosophila sechellia]
MVPNEKSFPRGGTIHTDAKTDDVSLNIVFGASQKKVKKAPKVKENFLSSETEEQNGQLEAFSAETQQYGHAAGGHAGHGSGQGVDSHRAADRLARPDVRPHLGGGYIRRLHPGGQGGHVRRHQRVPRPYRALSGGPHRLRQGHQNREAGHWSG